MLAWLTKSRFLKGRQCSRRLWLATRGIAEPVVESEDVWEEREIEGAAVEAYAELLFGGAARIIEPSAVEEVEARSATLDDALAKTEVALAAHRPVLQAHLRADRLLAIVDILEPRGDGWFVWEVKASTEPKPIHDWDLVFQCAVAERAGLRIVGAGLILLDRDFVRDEGEIEPARLLRRVERTADVQVLRPAVTNEIERQLAVLALDAMPDDRPATRCKGSTDNAEGNRPSDCGHLAAEGICGAELPRYWAGRLPRLQGKRATAVFALEDQSIERISVNARGVQWTENQARCILAVTSGEPVVDASALRAELAKLRWPVAYVDFEFDPGMAVPRFAGCRPYDKLPFQWSMLVQEESGGEVAERAPFLHLADTDPRRSFAESFLAALPSSGSIVAHHASVEWNVLRNLGESLGSDLATKLAPLKARFFDTEKLARAGYCHADQHGSWSIKKLAPALLGHGYDDLAIQDGMAAVVAWRQACREGDSATREKLEANLLAYCGRDTYLMHAIVERLSQLSGVR